jgi:hypothetical protein
MGPRASLIVLTALALALGLAATGCGDDSTASGGSDMAFPGGHDMGMGGCRIDIHAVDIVTGKPKTTAPARLIASLTAAGTVSPMWDIERGSTGEHFAPMMKANDFNVSYDAMDADTWIFSVQTSSGFCNPKSSVPLSAETGRKVVYILRATPDESSLYTRSDTVLTLIGGSPQTMKTITLDSGTPVSGTLHGPSGGVKGEVRFIGQNAAPDAVTTTGNDGSFTLAVLGAVNYTPLLIPASPLLAPHLGVATSGVMLASPSATFDVTAGATVTGTIVDGAPTPAGVNGAHVTMRVGDLPSGVGQADASGAFTLHAEPATYTLSFGAHDWPEATREGVDVPAAGTSMTIAYTVGRVAVGGSVVASNGTTPIPGARVTITSHPLGDIATVGIGGAMLAAQGRVARVEVTDGNGALPAMQLPLGTYDIIVEPPGPTAATDGLTAITKVLGGAATWTLKLDPPVTLTGTVRGPTGQGFAGAQVTAIELVGLGAAPTTTTDGNGVYRLTVGRGAPVQLVVDPPASVNLAGVRQKLDAGTTAAPDVALGPGLQVSGVVQAPTTTQSVVPLVRVDALCTSCDSTAPVASAISDGNGNYKLYLPDPGQIVLDGGAGD